MVDFQSRDTRRGLGGSDEDDEDDDTEEATTDEERTESAETEPTDERPADDATETVSDAGTQSSDDDPLEDNVDKSTGTTVTTEAVDSESVSTDAESASVPETDPEAEATTDQSQTVGAPTSKTAATEPATPQADVPVDIAVVTVGTTTEQGTDPTAERIEDALESAGHTVTARERLRGEYDGIQQAVDTLVGRSDVDVVVTAGGTGIKRAEATIEAVHPLFEKALPGFGEAFRTLLFEQIGTGIVAVRATAGIADETPVFCLPGDEQAALLAVEEIIATEAGELVAYLAQSDDSG